MSIVCCKVTKDKIEIAADSVTVRGYTQTKNQNIKYSKLVQIESRTAGKVGYNEGSALEGIILGSVGYTEESVLMQVFCQTHKPLSSTQNGFIVFLSEFSSWKNKKIEKSDINNSYIFIFQRKAFYAHGYLVQEILGYEAIGVGEDFALAALHLGYGVRKAVEVACELSVYCEQPIIHYEIHK